MTINKFTHNTPEKPFHSHTFAEAASGSSMGSTSAQSFGQRHRIDQNRQVVRRYGESSVANSSVPLREELYRRMDERPGHKHDKHKYRATRQGFNAGESPISGAQAPPSSRQMQVPRRNFSEPSSRNYNPYG